MQKETEKFEQSRLRYTSGELFLENSNITVKVYSVIFNLEVLMMYLESFGLDKDCGSTYLSKLLKLNRYLGFVVSKKDIISIKTLRNTLVHDVDSTITLFDNIESKGVFLDKVLMDIMTMIEECRRCSMTEIKEKQDELKKSSLFTKQ